MASGDNSTLIGRDIQLRRLRELLGDDSTHGVALVTGPAGIGKSTLLQALVPEARKAGVRVGWGVAGEWEGAAPLWPWFDAITAIDPDQTVVASGTETDLANRDKVEVFRSVVQWLGTAAADGPVLLVLEDMHVADPTALELLGYLSRRPPQPGVLIVASARPGCAPIESLRCPRIALSGLTAREVEELAQRSGETLEHSAAVEVARRTDGNPLFVQRLLEQGHATGGTQRPPADVVALLREQVDAVDAQVLPLLDALAVLGTTTPALLQRTAGGDLAVSALIAAAPGVVLIEHEMVAFKHALFREMLYDDLPASRRFALHATAAEVLRDSGAGPIVLAHHLGRAASANRGREAADAAWQTAQIERSMGALAEALDHYTLAASIFRELGDNQATAHILVDSAEVLAQSGRVVDAEQQLLAAVEFETDLDMDLRRRVIREYGRLRWREEPNPSQLSARSLERLARQWLEPESAPADIAALHIALVGVGEIRGLERSDLAYAEAAVSAALQSGDPQLIGEAHLCRRRALMVYPPCLAERRESAEAAIRAAREADDPELLSRARRMAQTDALASGDRERSLTLVNVEAVSAAEREQLALSLAGTAALEGRYGAADEILDEAIKDLAYLGLETPSLEFVRLIFSWDRGELVEALREFEPLLPVVADPGLRAALALSKAMAGQHDVAAELIDETFAGLTTDETPSLLWTMAMAMVAEAAAAIDHPRTGEIFEAFAPFSGEFAIPAAAPLAWTGAIDRPLGLLCLRLGRDADAVMYLSQSVVAHERMRAEPWLARSLAALAVAKARVGDADEAVALRARSNEIKTRLGMGDGVPLIGEFSVEPSADLPGDDAATSGDSAEAGSPNPVSQSVVSQSAVLRREGDYWQVGIGTRVSTIRHTTGLDYLARLIEQPEVDWHVLDLYATVAGAPVVVEGHAGVMLDNEARQAYQRRYQELSSALDEADSFADAGRVESIRDEIEALEGELLSAFGLGGRPRTMGDPTEKARINVRRSIARALDRIGETSPTLADHLRKSVHTGRFCRYSPDPTATLSW